MRKSILYCSIICMVIFGFYNVYYWKSPPANYNAAPSIQADYESIHNHSHCTLDLISMNNTFHINYIKNTDQNAINPYFPAVYITTTASHTAWIQIIYTDHPQWSKIIDTVHPDSPHYKFLYPFYTYNQHLYDAPLCEYTLFL